jgi:hypothetical protein
VLQRIAHSHATSWLIATWRHEPLLHGVMTHCDTTSWLIATRRRDPVPHDVMAHSDMTLRHTVTNHRDTLSRLVDECSALVDVLCSIVDLVKLVTNDHVIDNDKNQITGMYQDLYVHSNIWRCIFLISSVPMGLLWTYKVLVISVLIQQ